MVLRLRIMDATSVVLYLRTLIVVAQMYRPVPPIHPWDLTPENLSRAEEALKDPSKRRILDPVWSAELERIQERIMPVDLEPIPPINGSYYQERFDWYLAGFGEVPYAAVLYDVRGSAVPEVSLEKGRACGGILMSPAKVMTSCACLWQWLRVQYHHIPEQISEWSIGLNYSAGSVPAPDDPLGYFEVRLMFNAIYFDPNSEYKLSEDLPLLKWYQEDCFVGTLDQFENEGKGKLGKLAQNHGVVIARFEPPVHSPVDVYITWPPNISPIQRDVGFGTAQLLGFGFQKRPTVTEVFHDDYGFELSINNSLISVRLEGSCPMDDIVSHALKDAYGNETECAYVASTTKYELCGGLIGSVVVRNGKAFGILIKPIDCQETKRRAFIKAIYSRTYHLIEAKVGADLLLALNAQRPPHRRESDTVDYVNYVVMKPNDDYFDDFSPHSRGAFLSVSSSLLILDIILMTIK